MPATTFYATYSQASAGGLPVSATQGTTPWLVAGQGTAGSAATGVVTVQGISGGTAIPISGSITATNPSVSATGSAIPADATMVGGSDGTDLRALACTAAGILEVIGSGTAGSAASGVVTVQGVASMTPVQVSQATASSLNATVVGAGTAGSPSGGVVSIQGVTSGQAIPISGSVTANAGTGTFTTTPSVNAATFQDGSIAFGSLTTSYQTVVTTGGVAKIVQIRNNTNGVVVVSLNGGTSTSYTLDAGDEVSDDLNANGTSIASSTALQAKYSGGAPTSGSIRINVVY